VNCEILCVDVGPVDLVGLRDVSSSFNLAADGQLNWVSKSGEAEVRRKTGCAASFFGPSLMHNSDQSFLPVLFQGAARTSPVMSPYYLR
jgi:hypothetical protein